MGKREKPVKTPVSQVFQLIFGEKRVFSEVSQDLHGFEENGKRTFRLVQNHEKPKKPVKTHVFHQKIKENLRNFPIAKLNLILHGTKHQWPILIYYDLFDIFDLNYNYFYYLILA